MSQSGGLDAISSSSRSNSPGSLKRKRDTPDPSQSRLAAGVTSNSAGFASGAPSSTTRPSHDMASGNGAVSKQYTSPDSDEMQTDNGDMLRGLGSASSRTSAASSVFTQNSHAFAQNRKGSAANGLTPLTNLTESSPPKGNSPLPSKPASAMESIDGVVASTHVPASDGNDLDQERTTRPQMLPPPGKVKGYRAVWDPELDGKLSKEERKRATYRKRDFGAEVRYIFHILLSLRNMIHIT